jgi:hypothetical protein
MDIAEAIKSRRMHDNVHFIQTYNKFEKHGNTEDQPSLARYDKQPTDVCHQKIGHLFSYLSGAGTDDTHALVYNWTIAQSKSAAMNGVLAVTDVLPNVQALHILDRNANCFQLEALLDDYERILTDKELVILTPIRNTSNTYDPIGRQSEAIEGGQGSTFMALTDKIGTGWENLMAVYFNQITDEMACPDYPLMPLSADAYCALVNSEHAVKDFEFFGVVGFGPNAIGQSEDLWAVLHQTHNAIGLGHSPNFDLMQAPATKRRESSSSFEILAAATRWAGGLVDTLRSPINQRISFFGPESIFERKARRSVERFYLATPVGVLSIVLLFPSIFFDMNPFVGILLMVWAAALLFNQVLSLHGLVAVIRARGAVSFK